MREMVGGLGLLANVAASALAPAPAPTSNLNQEPSILTTTTTAKKNKRKPNSNSNSFIANKTQKKKNRDTPKMYSRRPRKRISSFHGLKSEPLLWDDTRGSDSDNITKLVIIKYVDADGWGYLEASPSNKDFKLNPNAQRLIKLSDVSNDDLKNLSNEAAKAVLNLFVENKTQLNVNYDGQGGDWTTVLKNHGNRYRLTYQDLNSYSDENKTFLESKSAFRNKKNQCKPEKITQARIFQMLNDGQLTIKKPNR